jgi:hypothetical protein
MRGGARGDHDRLLAVPPGDLPLPDPAAARRLPAGIKFIFTAPTEGFMLNMKMAFFVGIFAAAPFLLYQVWSFIAPRPLSNERIWAIPFIGSGRSSSCWRGVRALLLFPSTFEFLGQFANATSSTGPKVDEYFSFYSWFLLGLGLVFQLPVVIFVLSPHRPRHAGFLITQLQVRGAGHVRRLRRHHAGGDMMTQTLLAGPRRGSTCSAWARVALRQTPRPESQAISKD